MLASNGIDAGWPTAVLVNGAHGAGVLDPPVEVNGAGFVPPPRLRPRLRADEELGLEADVDDSRDALRDREEDADLLALRLRL